jgi:hypothetical protein
LPPCDISPSPLLFQSNKPSDPTQGIALMPYALGCWCASLLSCPALKEKKTSTQRQWVASGSGRRPLPSLSILNIPGLRPSPSGSPLALHLPREVRVYFSRRPRTAQAPNREKLSCSNVTLLPMQLHGLCHPISADLLGCVPATSVTLFSRLALSPLATLLATSPDLLLSFGRT